MSNAMLLTVHKIKDAWRWGKVAAALFLDVQGAFPNMVKEQLLYNMKMHRVPKCFTSIVFLLLTGPCTSLKFNDYISTQEDLSSMNYYAFYNAPVIETAICFHEWVDWTCQVILAEPR